LQRGRPSEQTRRLTAEGATWDVVYRAMLVGDYGLSLRQVARRTRCRSRSSPSYSPAAVCKTFAWKYYRNAKESTQKADALGRRTQRRRAHGMEARLWQIIRQAIHEERYQHTVRELAQILGCSKSAVQKTTAWGVYHAAKQAYVEENRRKLSERYRS